MTRRRTVPNVLLPLLATVGLVLGVGPLGSGAATAASTSATAPAAAPTGDVGPALTWHRCGGTSSWRSYECATLVAPLDRRTADGRTVSLALVRHRATGAASQRLGSLVFNPGGPGGSGLASIDWAWAVLPAAVRSRFDLVTWDPRGVGSSVPALVGCASPWPARPMTGPVSWQAVVTAYGTQLATANARCEQRNGDLVNHMGTMETVADLDRIRSAVGDARLTYWGMSYGTRIGYVYALTHPDRVRALVLDGSIDPTSTLLSLTEGGAAPDQAFGALLQAQPTVQPEFRSVLTALEAQPIRLPDGSRFDRWAFLDIIFNNVAQQAAYPALAGFVQVARTALTGAPAARTRALAVLQSVRDQNRQQNSNAGSVFSVVNCLDYPQRPTTPQRVAAVRAQVRLAPYWGGTLATMYASGCSGLRLSPDPVPVVTGTGSAVPVLIAGATRDGSTIVQWTARMSRAFPDSRTVTYAGGQHVVFGLAGSSCIDAPITRYLLTTRLPAMDVACPNVVRPATVGSKADGSSDPR